MFCRFFGDPSDKKGLKGDIPIHVCCIGKMKMEFVFDDSLLVGHEKAIQQTIDDLKKRVLI